MPFEESLAGFLRLRGVVGLLVEVGFSRDRRRCHGWGGEWCPERLRTDDTARHARDARGYPDLSLGIALCLDTKASGSMAKRAPDKRIHGSHQALASIPRTTCQPPRCCYPSGRRSFTSGSGESVTPIIGRHREAVVHCDHLAGGLRHKFDLVAHAWFARRAVSPIFRRCSH